ncbi:NAD(P)H-dependent glycerol-3-phosphate dehydrogenase [Arsenicicoccus sp. oral taxon 190]|uniref:NAD(P)H-dependent glycerol-3-phosphate dehydrogenase n=1 Tax=Arsenicicoccus sp. oral taxon 190 TaxID=1658671 RepID=UPI000679F7E2|nr:NAD(P)H-dependent glycerol-3-phosphate dehydrogenase [Arsenicicoccus sp. oral taxon 190]AKT52273.1 glycerol-3-phosphate dehydrogenase [Arsenicicoccus sp. oral taxon 190]
MSSATRSRVAVLGTGSWGTAFSTILAHAGNDVVMWGRRSEVTDEIRERHTNAQYLPGLRLPEEITATSDVAEAVSDAAAVILAVPSQSLRANLETWAPSLPAGAAYVSLMKGIELGTGKRMSEVISEVGGVPAEQVAVVTGPNLAREIIRRDPAASVVASSSRETAERVAHHCATPYFRPYTETDVVGCELGGATKNVVALAVGMAEGLGLGDNSKASIITRGLAETTRLGVRLGADPLTFSGLAGVGDLIATCMSPLSRNHSFGVKLGQGMTVEEVVTETRQVAEGVKSAESILELARSVGVDMPIVEQVAAVVHDGRDPQEVVTALMSRARKSERR